MRIAFASASYAPEPTGIGPYSAELAELLTARGHEVRAVTAFPFYPDWVPRVPRGTVLYRTEQRAGVSVTRCRVYVPRDPQPLRRLAHELAWLGVSAFPVARLVRWADVWIVVAPPFGSALLGAALVRLLGARVHLHVQDLVPDVAIESGQLRSRMARRAVKFVARWAYRSFRSASVLSNSMATALSRYAAPDTAVVVAPNWVRRTHGASTQLPEVLQGGSYAVYAGSFGRKQELNLLVDAADLLARRGGPIIAVLGDGPGREALKRGGSHLKWLGLVDDATYASVVGGALAGIVTLVPGMADSVVPSKLAGYLAAGRPVVVAAGPNCEAARLVTEVRCGVVLPPGRADLLADALCQLAGDPGACEGQGERGREYAAEHWNRERIVSQLEAALCDLVAA